MALELCAACKTRVIEGAVRCTGCGANLYRPGIFSQTMGWVAIAVSLVPFAIGEVTVPESDFIPIFIAVAILVLGIFMVVLGRSRSKSDDRDSGPLVVAGIVEDGVIKEVKELPIGSGDAERSPQT